MKFFKNIVTIFLSTVLLAACDSTEAPESVVLKFCTAIEKMDFETVKKYVAKESAPVFDILMKMTEEEQVDEDESDIEVVIKNVEISEDKESAIVIVEMVDSRGVVVDESNILLVKEEGAWKVVIGN